MIPLVMALKAGLSLSTYIYIYIYIYIYKYIVPFPTAEHEFLEGSTL